MNIYVASSWRNPSHQDFVAFLKSHTTHEIYNFQHPKPDNEGFSWGDIAADWKGWTPGQFREGLKHLIAQAGFECDMWALRQCAVAILLLPCGRSAHLEVGWAAGAGKGTLVYCPPGVATEPELMYKMLGLFCLSEEEVLENLKTLEGR